MQLDDADLKMLRWLRRQHESWPMTRLIILACSAASVAYAGWLTFSDYFDFQAGFFLVIGGYGLSYTLGSWSGRPEVSLLLKLVEANMPDEKPEDRK
jgi:hypothetical protein